TIVTNVQKANQSPVTQTPVQPGVIQETPVTSAPVQSSYAHAPHTSTTTPAVQPRQELLTDTAKGLLSTEENNNDQELIAAQPKPQRQRKTPQFDFNYVPPPHE